MNAIDTRIPAIKIAVISINEWKRRKFKRDTDHEARAINIHTERVIVLDITLPPTKRSSLKYNT